MQNYNPYEGEQFPGHNNNAYPTPLSGEGYLYDQQYQDLTDFDQYNQYNDQYNYPFNPNQYPSQQMMYNQPPPNYNYYNQQQMPMDPFLQQQQLSNQFDELSMQNNPISMSNSTTTAKEGTNFGLPLLDQNVIKASAAKKTKELLKKQREEKILDALERQTELLYDIANKYKRRAEEEERMYLQKIKKLEREKQELLLLNRNDEIVNERVYFKYQLELQQFKRLGFFTNPYAATADPFYFPMGNGEEEEKKQEEKPKRKKKSSKTIKAAEDAEKKQEISTQRRGGIQ